MFKKVVSLVMSFVFLFTFSFTPSPVRADDPPDQVIEDTYVDSTDHDANFGSSEYMSLLHVDPKDATVPALCSTTGGSSAVQAADQIGYLKIDVSSIPGWKVVQSATLNITVTDKLHLEGKNVSVNQVFDNGWSDSSLSWDSRGNAIPDVEQLDVQEIVTELPKQTLHFNITDAIAGNGIYSFALQTNFKTAFHIASSEAAEADRPSVTIVYSDDSALEVSSASADTYLDHLTPTTIHGEDTQFKVKKALTGNNEKYGYLKFDVSGIPNEVAIRRAKLSLTATSTAGSVTGTTYLSAYRVTNTGWEESGVNGLTWDTSSGFPPDADPLSLAPILTNQTTDQYIDLDVTSAVTGNGTYSFAIKTTSTDALTFAAKESSNCVNGTGTCYAPRLVIEYEDHLGHTMAPTQDTYINKANPDQVRGSLASLLVASGNQADKIAYLKFNVSQLAEGEYIHDAKLNLTALTTNGTSGETEQVSVYKVVYSDWDESTLNWSNHGGYKFDYPLSGDTIDSLYPADYEPIDTVPILAGQSTEQTIALDVRGVVDGNGTYSFAIATSSQAILTFASSNYDAANCSTGCKGPSLELDVPHSKVERTAPDQDAEVSQADSGVPVGGNEAVMNVCGACADGVHAAYFKYKFDKNDFNVEDIRRATFNVFGSTEDTQSMELHGLSNTLTSDPMQEWLESGVTYDTLNPSDGDTGLIGIAQLEGNSTAALKTFDITEYLKNTFRAGSGNVSLQLQGTTDGGVTIYSKDAAGAEAAYKPYLEVTFFSQNIAMDADYTYLDKEAQRKRGDALIAEVEQAMGGSGPIDIVLNADTNYRFRKGAGVDGDPFLNMAAGSNDPHSNDRRNISIDCQDSTLWFEDARAGLYLQYNGNITVENCQFDYDPLPFTQGVVTSVDPTGESFDVELDPGFSSLYALKYYNGEPGDIKINFYDNRNSYGATYQKIETNNFDLTDLKRTGSRQFHVEGKTPTGDPEYKDLTFSDMNLTPGDFVVFKLRIGGSQAIKTDSNDNLSFDNVHIYSSPFLAAAVQNTTDNVAFSNSSIETRPSTRRLLSSSADGFNVRNAGGNLTVDHSRFESTGDDMLVIHALYQGVAARVDDTHYIFQGNRDNSGLIYRYHEPNVTTNVYFYQMTAGDYTRIGSADIASATLIDGGTHDGNEGIVDTLCENMEDKQAELENDDFWGDMAKNFYSITLSAPPSMETGYTAAEDIGPFTLVDIPRQTSTVAQVTYSTFRNGNNHAMFLNSASLQIQHNDIGWMRRNAINTDVDLQIGIMGGGPLQGGTIAYNNIKDSNIGWNIVTRSNYIPGAIGIGLIRKDLVYNDGTWDPKDRTDQVFANRDYFRNLSIDHNIFSRIGGYVLFLLNTAGFDIENNKVYGACTLDRYEETNPWLNTGAEDTTHYVPDRLYYADASGNMTFMGNTFDSAAPHCGASETYSPLEVGPQIVIHDGDDDDDIHGDIDPYQRQP